MTVKIPFFLTSSRKRFQTTDRILYAGSALLITLFSCFSLLRIEQAQLLFDVIKLHYNDHFGWLLVFLPLFYFIVSIGLVLTPVGRIRLGGASAEPDYNYFQWLLMVLCSGINIGYVVWSVGEPVSHLLNPPSALSSVSSAMLLTSVHWGFYHWVLYSLVGLGVAYAVYNRGLPLKLSSALEPVLGRAYRKWSGLAVDAFMITVTFFCMTITLGLLVRLIGCQLSYVLAYETHWPEQVVLLTAIALLLIWSVLRPVSKGMLRLSKVTTAALILLMGMTLVLGPTTWLTDLISSNFINYMRETVYPDYIAELMTYTPGWTGGWTVFYMLMWLSWAPVTGMFIAKISRGRTIREFIIGVMIIPPLLTLIWFGTFGGTGIHDTLFGSGQIAKGVSEQIKVGMFVLLEQMPGSSFWQIISSCLVILLCVTSNDASVRVISTIISRNNTQPDSLLRISLAIGVSAFAFLLLITGGLNTILSAAVFSGAAFAMVLFLIGIGLLKSFLEDYRRGKHHTSACQTY